MTFDITPFRKLYPFSSHWLDLDGLRYHYIDEGNGDPVVCVHGNPTWSFFFRNIVSDLASTHRVIAVDHIGCGLSDKPSDNDYSYTLNRRINDLEYLLDQLKLQRNVTLILHDWGGMIGIGAALRNPKRISKLVLLNTAAFMLPPAKRFPLRLRLIRNTPLFAPLMVRGLNAFAKGAVWMASKKGLSRDVALAYCAPYDSWRNRIATLRFVEDIPLGPRHRSFQTAMWVDSHLHMLSDIPKLICWGMRDFVFDIHFLAEWRRRFTDAEVHVFPNAGHYCLEDAGDEIIPLISGFVCGTSQAEEGESLSNETGFNDH